MARVTSRSSTMGRDTCRENSVASTMAPSRAIRDATITSRRAPLTISLNRDVPIDTRTNPWGCRIATYISSSPADALDRIERPTPAARACTTSGRVP